MYYCDQRNSRQASLLTLAKCLRIPGIWSPDSSEVPEEEDTIRQANQAEGQRILKTHLSLDMLPNQLMQKKAKVYCSIFLRTH